MPSLGAMLDNPQSQAARAKRQAERLAVQQTDQESQRAAALAAARLVQAAPAIAKPAEQPASLIAKAEAPQIAPQAAPVAANLPIATLPANANGPFYALATRRLRTTAESEQLAAAMRSLLRAPSGVPLRVDTLAEGKDWRVVSWPYSSRSSAEQARAQLVARGLKVDVVDF
jgi:SPOR domain